MENKKIFSALRSPVTVIKKRSGPLDEALEKLYNEEASSSWASSNVHNLSNIGNKLRRCSIKEKKRERWLLTRKTWRYMTDAGRKLIPDSNPDNIALIEEQFQSVCSSEPRFLLWRRKASYPGASLSSKRRPKLLSRHSSKNRHSYNQDRIIELLQTYLKLRDAYNKTTTLLGTKTVRPDQTWSPSSQRPQILSSKNEDEPSCLDLIFQTELLNRLKLLSESILLEKEDYIQLELDDISPKILEDKVLLKKIYRTLKKNQLHRALHSKEPSKSKYSNISYSASSLSSLHKSRNHNTATVDNTMKSYNRKTPEIISQKNCKSQEECDIKKNVLISQRNHKNLEECDTNKNVPQVSKPDSLYLYSNNSLRLSQKSLENSKIFEKAVSTASQGTQTNFIQLSELKRLAEEYNYILLQHSNYLKSDSTEEKDIQNGRKSSIDNEDISQSVSDTIKRYLKMARKKSVHDTDATNKFRSINYDITLRNIKAKGEINPPGMNDGLNKAIQTLDAWPLIALDFIRGNESSINLKNAHIQWGKLEDERRENILKWRRSQKLNGHNVLDNTSAPTSPSSHSRQFQDKSLRPASSGLLSSSSHFLSNIWHGHQINTTETSISTVKDKIPNICKYYNTNKYIYKYIKMM